MKKLLIGLLALGSISAFAISNPDDHRFSKSDVKIIVKSQLLQNVDGIFSYSKGFQTLQEPADLDGLFFEVIVLNSKNTDCFYYLHVERRTGIIQTIEGNVLSNNNISESCGNIWQ